MPRNETIDRVIDGVTDNGNVWVDLLRNGNARLYRFNRLVIDELERTQEERAKVFSNGPPRRLILPAWQTRSS